MTPKSLLVCLGLVALVGLAVVWYTKAKREDEARATHIAQQAIAGQKATREKINGLVSKYNAIRVPRKSPGDFSVYYTDMLVRPDGRAIAFLGILGDVAKSGNDLSLVFNSYEPSNSDLAFDLRCGSEATKEAMSAGRFTRWAVVAAVSSVSFGGGWSTGGPVAQGECLEILRLDDSLTSDDVFDDGGSQK